MPRRVATVDINTWLFPEHTLLALARWLGEEKLDEAALKDLVIQAVANRDLQIRVDNGEIQYRLGSEDLWHDIAPLSRFQGAAGAAGATGATGATGAAGKDGLDGANAYPRMTYEQSLPSDTWTIPHTFPYIPDVVLLDSAGSVLEGELTFPDSSTVVVLFNSPTSGTAYLS